MEYWGVWTLGRYLEALGGENIAFAPFPVNKVATSTGWYSPWTMTRMSKVKDETWDWMWHNTMTGDGARSAVVNGMVQPIYKGLAHVFLEGKPKSVSVFNDEFSPQTFRSPGDTIGSFFGSYKAEWDQTFDPIYDPVWRGDKTALEAGQEARPKLEKLLKTGEMS